MENSNNSNQKQFQEREGKFSFFQAMNEAISGFSERFRGIIRARYGISKGGPKTLEKIGKEYNITRERVRQIIQEALKKTRAKKDSSVSLAREKIAFTISSKNGIIEKEKLVSLVANIDVQEAAAVRFFLDCFKDYTAWEIKKELKKSYTLTGFDIEQWRKLKNIARNILESEKRLLTSDELAIRMAHRLGSEAEAGKIFDWLAVSEEIKKNNFGKWGISSWEEVTPRNTREKAYLVLKETGEPLHFTRIAELIDKHKLSKKKTHFQTVHNELIKDDRFVLIGRGVYALSEWGYKQGTVREILKEILKKNARPMKREDILGEVLKMRQVKKSTVMINLNNFFVRTGKNEYTVRK